MCKHPYIQVRKHTQACIHTCTYQHLQSLLLTVCTSSQTHVRMQTHRHMYARKHTDTCTHQTHRHMYARKHTHPHTHVRTQTHTPTYTHRHMYARKHTHPHTHMHVQAPAELAGFLQYAQTHTYTHKLTHTDTCTPANTHLHIHICTYRHPQSLLASCSTHKLTHTNSHTHRHVYARKHTPSHTHMHVQAPAELAGFLQYAVALHRAHMMLCMRVQPVLPSTPRSIARLAELLDGHKRCVLLVPVHACAACAAQHASQYSAAG